MERIGRKIRELRVGRGMTQEKLAEKLNVSFQAVSKWETGSASPDLSMIAPLARVFGVTSDELLGISPEKDPREEELEKELDKIVVTPKKDGRFDVIAFREKAKAAKEAYPGNMRLLYHYANSLRTHVDGEPWEKYREGEAEAEAILRHILDEATDPEDSVVRRHAVESLVAQLTHKGRKKEALALTERFPCPDKIKLMCLRGREQTAFFQFAVLRSLHEITDLFGIGIAELEDKGIKAAARDVWEGILRAAVPDGNYANLSHSFANCLYWKAADLTERGDYDAAVAVLSEIMEMWDKVDRRIGDPKEKKAYTAPLFEGVEVSPIFDRSGENTYAARFAMMLRLDPRFSPLAGREEFEYLLDYEYRGEP